MSSGLLLSGRYRLQSLLGKGGMASVWKAHDERLHAPVAIKLMAPEWLAQPELRHRFEKEARAAANLRSAHVVQVFDHGVDPASGTPFIAMELLEGESLAARLRSTGRLTPQATARVVTEVARGLSRAHAAGVLHRDLKPANVFLVRNEDEEIAKVVDFGIAKFRGPTLDSEETGPQNLLGTPCYMSPEQFTCLEAVDHTTDLWALGVLAFQCLTGRRPFEGANAHAIAVAVCSGVRPRPSDLAVVPLGFDAWFERCTHPDPRRRFQSAKTQAEALRVLCDDGIGARSGAQPIGSQDKSQTLGVNLGLALDTSPELDTSGSACAPAPNEASIGSPAVRSVPSDDGSLEPMSQAWPQRWGWLGVAAALTAGGGLTLGRAVLSPAATEAPISRSPRSPERVGAAEPEDGRAPTPGAANRSMVGPRPSTEDAQHGPPAQPTAEEQSARAGASQSQPEAQKRPGRVPSVDAEKGRALQRNMQELDQGAGPSPELKRRRVSARTETPDARRALPQDFRSRPAMPPVPQPSAPAITNPYDVM